MKARSLECRQASPKSPEEIFKWKKEAWNETPESRHFVLNSQQMSKLSNKRFEMIMQIGNELYGGDSNGIKK